MPVITCTLLTFVLHSFGSGAAELMKEGDKDRLYCGTTGNTNCYTVWCRSCGCHFAESWAPQLEEWQYTRSMHNLSMINVGWVPILVRSSPGTSNGLKYMLLRTLDLDIYVENDISRPVPLCTNDIVQELPGQAKYLWPISSWSKGLPSLLRDYTHIDR